MKLHSPPFVVVLASFLLFSAVVTRAAVVTWDVDPTASFVRLTIPDQLVNVTGIGQVTARLRDAGDNSQWTDAGGRRAAIDGSIVTEYADGTSIQFMIGAHNLYALEQVNLRPNPADWGAQATGYVGTTTAPAGFGAKARGTYTILTFDIAFLAFRQVRFDVRSDLVPLAGGAFAGGQTQFGILSALSDVDGLELPLGLGQPVPDLLGAPLGPVVDANSGSGAITDLGGLNRKLTYNINAPLYIDVQGTILTGSTAGLIVAYGQVSAPPVLRIWQGDTNTIVLAWPTSAAGFVLEQNPVLGTTNWVEMTNAPVPVGSEQQVTVPVAPGGAFYRLRSQ